MANEITSANAATAIVKLVAADFLPPLVGNLVAGNLVNRNYDGLLGNGGDVVNIPIAPNSKANNIAEGGSVTNQNSALGNAQVVLNRHIESSFAIPDVTRVLTVPNLVALYTQSAMIAIAEQIETDIFSLYAQFNYNAQQGSSNTALTEATIDTTETTLFNAKVPPGRKYLITSGTAYGQLRQIPRFTEFQMTGPSGQPSSMLTGELAAAGAAGAGGDGTGAGTVKGLTCYRSQYIQKVSSTTYNMCFSRDAIGLAMRTLPIPMPGTGAIGAYASMGGFNFRIIMSYTPSQLQQQFTVDAFYGVGVLRNNFGIAVLS